MHMKRNIIFKSIFFILFISVSFVLYAQEVGPNGELIYSYPLDLPSGTNGVGPNLSLVYNSHAGNSMLGLAWSLNGIPALTRDASCGIEFGENDHYLFNGEKLIYAEPAEGGDGFYHTERESFVRIEAFDLNTASSYWKITRKDGTILYFGLEADEHEDDTDGRITALGQGNDIALLWSLSKVEDVHGNYYIIEYHEDATKGDYYPRRITYTKNSENLLNSQRTIEFSYETRTDHGPLYVPTLMDVDMRLKYISVFIGTEHLKKYRLDYDNNGFMGRSRITSIQEYGFDGDWPMEFEVDVDYEPTGSVLPAITFEWENGEEGLFSSYQFNSGGNYTSYVGDFNGDGFADIFHLNPTKGKEYLWKSNGVDGFESTPSFPLSYSYSPLIGDFDGNGCTDLFINRPADEQDFVWLFDHDGNYTSKDYSIEDNYKPVVGDFNGDGRSDIFLYNSDLSYIWFANGGDFTIVEYEFPVVSIPLVGDFDGNGCMDLFMYSAGNTTDYVLLFNHDGSYTSLNHEINGRYVPLVGDYNGDGCDDIFFFGIGTLPYSSNEYIWYSKGDGNFLSKSYAIGSTYIPRVGDFNGDGITDVFIFRYKDNEYLWLFKGDYTYESLPIGIGSTYEPIVGDYNGDGCTDVFIYRVGSDNDYLFSFIKVSKNNILTINNGMGQTVNIEYTLSTKYQGAFDPTDNTYPILANTSPRPLVTRIEVDPGEGPIISYTYDYHDGKFLTGKPYDRANLGFAWVKKTDEATVQAVKTYFHQDDRYLRGLVYKQEQFGSDELVYSRVLHTYDKQVTVDNSGDPQTHDAVFVFRETSVTEVINGAETGDPLYFRQEYEYDEYGNMVRAVNYGEVQKIGQDYTDLYEDKVEVLVTYIENTNTWVMAPEKKEVWAYKLDGSYERVKADYFEYDDGFLKNGLLTKIDQVVSQDGGEELITRKYFYDAWGNLKEYYDPRRNNGEYTDATAAISYDTNYKTYITQTVNALLPPTTYSYDSLMRLTEVADINGSVWQTEYDVFGRVKALIDPGDNQSDPTTAIEYAPNDAFPYWIKSEKQGGQLESILYVDGLGRPVQAKSIAAVGYNTVDFYYNDSGRRYMTSLPYVSTESVYTLPEGEQFTEAAFDEIGRVISITKPDTTSRQVVYGRRKSYVIDEKDHAVSTEVWGTEIIKKTYQGEYGSLSEYTVTTIEIKADSTVVTDHEGNEISTTHDMLGRILSRTSPDTGLWSYEYDVNSNLTELTDAKTQTITMQYDILNRLTDKSYPGSTVQYLYDENGHGLAKGSLTQVLYPEGSEWYEYDNRGRLTSETHSITGAGSKTRSFDYDSLNRLISQAYPLVQGETEPEVVTYTYEENGRLTTLSGIDTYISNFDYSELGAVTSVSYGNGLTANYDYYDQSDEFDATSGTSLSRRLRRIQVANDSYDVLDISYEYDRAGNVELRNIVIRTEPGSDIIIDENFDYDDLDRLISADSTAYGFRSYDYDEIDRITEKGGYTYNYDPAKPHAVQNDGRFSYTYDNNGNMTTRSDGRTLNWDYDDRLKSVTDSDATHIFSYNPGGARLKKQVTTTEGQTTVYYFFSTYEEEYTDGALTNSVKYYFANGERVAERSTVKGLLYYHKDHLGSLVKVSDAEGNLINISLCTPFGEEMEIEIIPDLPENLDLTTPMIDVTEEHKARDTVSVSASLEGTADVSCEAGKTIRLKPGFRTEKGVSFKAAVNYKLRIPADPYKARYTFTSKELDDTNLYYFGARYYDPAMGIFISADPAMDGLNWYTYCANNPMNYVDFWGLYTADNSEPGRIGWMFNGAMQDGDNGSGNGSGTGGTPPPGSITGAQNGVGEAYTGPSPTPLGTPPPNTNVTGSNGVDGKNNNSIDSQNIFNLIHDFHVNNEKNEVDELGQIAKDIFNKDKDPFGLKLKHFLKELCYARAELIAEELRTRGYTPLFAVIEPLKDDYMVRHTVVCVLVYAKRYMFEYVVPDERLGELLTEEQWDDLHKDIKSVETETIFYNNNVMLIKMFNLDPIDGPVEGPKNFIYYDSYPDFSRQYIDQYIDEYSK